ncbi:MAG: hypothetical protein IKR57_00935 [Bacilli bacterium]|nr:hypothetical protein [Bacilli bacterium]
MEKEKNKTAEKKNKLITKDRVISVVIGMLIGAGITAGIFCLCAKPRFPEGFNGEMTKYQENGERPKAPRYFDKNRRGKQKNPSTENSNETDKTTDDNTKTDN